MMKRYLLFFAGLVFCISLSSGQNLPIKETGAFFKRITEERTHGQTITPAGIHMDADTTRVSGVFNMIERLKSMDFQKMPDKPAGGDTLIIGIAPLDSLIVTGTYSHTGPVLVIGNGILRFKNANATIVGDLYVWGDHAVVTADSSYLYFPQQYFYQRSLVIAGKGSVVYRNTTLDHSGLSNNLVLSDSGKIQLRNITNVGFTTCGMNKASEIDVDGINQAGEFVIADQSKLHFSHAKTVLLWHNVPRSGVFHYSFPKGDTVKSWSLDHNTPGISGIEYSVKVDTSTGIMWALMPVTGSDVSISDSKIRSIGLWFLGHDTIAVNGLVDNTDYTQYIANLNDRVLHLSNSSVQTWSLYPMDTVTLNVTGCIVGEIGSEDHCSVSTTNAFVDGSGGYWWATGQTVMLADNCMAVNAIRSTQNGLFIFAYSTLSQGEASAMGNSIMIMVQSQLPDVPVLYDGSCIWYSYIGKPNSAMIDSLVLITGSAWIDKTPSSQLMGFGWYQLFWQKSGDSLWHPVSGKSYGEKRDEVLATWNTHGLAPGLYYLKLLLADNTADSFQTETVKGISLLPRIFGIDEQVVSCFNLRIFPDPLTAQSVISFVMPAEEIPDLCIVDQDGKIVFREKITFREGVNTFPIGNLSLPPGGYSLILKDDHGIEVKKFVKN